MKYTLHENLVLVMKPETREEQALVNLLSSKKLQVNGNGIDNAGTTWEEGRRQYLSFIFVDDNTHDTIKDEMPKLHVCLCCNGTGGEYTGAQVPDGGYFYQTKCRNCQGTGKTTDKA